jgi:hypothetical protein
MTQVKSGGRVVGTPQALGGWRAGVARLPDGPAGQALRGRLLGIGSETWSAAAPVQHAAALAFTEPQIWPSESSAAGPCTPRSAAPWQANSPPPG